MRKVLGLDDFRFVARIGRGQFGKVDAVRFTGDGKVYALKTIDKAKIGRVGEALNVDLERDILLRGSVTPSGSDSKWSPVPKLLATLASHSAVHIVFSFANCGTLWDLFCSTASVNDRSNAHFDEQWLQRDEGGNGTLFNAGSSMQSMDSNSLFKSITGTIASTGTKRLQEDTLVFYIRQLVLAVQWLHEEAKIVHRDVKPENILLADDGRAIICDFGSAARLLTGDKTLDVGNGVNPSRASIQSSSVSGVVWTQPRYLPLSACQTLHGTADYIAPEVLETYEQVLLDSDASIFRHQSDANPSLLNGKRGYDASVDWWSFGAMCYEMITGLAPFYARTVEETYCMIMSCQDTLRRPSESTCSSTLSDFLMNLLVPSQSRLGRLGPEEVKRHNLLRGTDWEKARNNNKTMRPSDFELPRPLDLPVESSTNVHSFGMSYGSLSPEKASWAYDFLEQTEHAGSLLDADQQYAAWFDRGSNFLQEGQTKHPGQHEDGRWAQWEWVSPHIACLDQENFGKHRQSAPPTAGIPKTGFTLPVLDKLRHEATPDREHLRHMAKHHQTPASSTPLLHPASRNRFTTPGLNNIAIDGQRHGSTMPLSVPRSIPRTLAKGSGQEMVIMSEKKALKLMARCVQESAKKKNLASAKKQKPLVELACQLNRQSDDTDNDNTADNPVRDRQKKSFMSRLQALSIEGSSKTVENIASDDEYGLIGNLGDGNSGNSERRHESPHGDAASLNPFALRQPRGFDAFVAELGAGEDFADFQSSPHGDRITSHSPYSSESSDESASFDGGSEDICLGISIPPAKAPLKEVISTGDLHTSLKKPDMASQARDVIPKCLERDELLSRLYPGFLNNPIATCRASHSNENPKGDYVKPTSVVSAKDAEAGNGDMSKLRPTLCHSNSTNGARQRESDSDSPTTRIEGLVGRHKRMERNLAYLEQVTRNVKERMEGLGSQV